MGYTTDFQGTFDLDRLLRPEHLTYLRTFSQTRRMRRNAVMTVLRPDPVRDAAKLSVGVEGGYFVGETGFHGQDDGPDVVNHNKPPALQPGLWCGWIPREEGDGIEWNGSEKFYDYVEWLEYLIAHFLQPWGYTLNGEVEWQGENSDDRGVIYCKNNCVQAVKDTVVRPKPQW